MVARIQYTTAREVMEKEITGIWKDLQSYKDKPGANADYIEKMERRLTNLMYFFRSADEAILEAEEMISQAYQKGKNATQQQEPYQRWNPAQKEDYRAFSINQAMHKWPELF